MSKQQSLLSFLSKTPKTANGHSAEKTPITTEKNPEIDNNTGISSSKKISNGNGATASTPKRKSTETPKSGSKKPKVTSSKSRKRLQIEDDEEEDVDVQELGNSTASPNGTMDEESLNSFQTGNDTNQAMDISEIDGIPAETDFEHTKFEFLKPENIRDSNHKRPDDDDYDPTTLYVPKSYSETCTPGLRVWWDFKSKHFDKILMFKVGKFYELYHMDAVIAVEALNLIYMNCSGKRRYAHCGFPEFVYGRNADLLVQKGYKVARIEQTETPDMLQKRMQERKSGSGKEKVVRRELCCVTTPGTKTSNCVDGTKSMTTTRFLLAVCENSNVTERRYGVCFVDCAVGKIWISEFDDDYHCSRFRTLLAQHPPAEVLYPRKRLSSATEAILNGLGYCKLEPLPWKSEFLTATNALKKLRTNNYFESDEKPKKATTTVSSWPDVLRGTLDEGDVLGTTCKKENELCISALGAIVRYMENCLIDYDILPMKLFERYEPIALGQQFSNVTKDSPAIPSLKNKTMILDAATLRNLDILQSSSKLNCTEGTLLELLDTCNTACGKRLLRQWLCNPLCEIDAIHERQKAIGALLDNIDFMERSSALLKQLPDLERLLQKIHTLGTKKRLDHPDSRAIMFEASRYNKRKVDEFLTTLDGFNKILELAKLFKSTAGHVKSPLLRQCLLTDADSHFPDLHGILKEIEGKFNREKAKEGILVMNEDIAEVNAEIAAVVAKFESYLKEQQKKFSCSGIEYPDCKGKNRYNLQVPEAIAKRMPDDYQFVGAVKGYKRFKTERLDILLGDLKKAEEARDAVFADSMRRVFELFSDRSASWRRAVECAAIVDVLLALARYARNCEHAVCIPDLVNANGNQKPFIEIINGYHPCSAKIFTSVGQFIPNDTIISKDSSASVLLLTGPNMGGKSTLMRQVASLVILSQIGSYVPAEALKLSVVDRVFTRLGASDRICAGQSTFAVELTETKIILNHATVHSLVIIDELGRGTATHDGAAIAYSVLKHLAERRVGPRTLFSTHYHCLVARFNNHDNIALGHMACEVENENEDDPSEETITFLYKLAPGACPKSYGFNAAKLAGIPNEIIKRAYDKARKTESAVKVAQRLRCLASTCQTMKDDELVEAVNRLMTADD